MTQGMVDVEILSGEEARSLRARVKELEGMIGGLDFKNEELEAENAEYKAAQEDLLSLKRYAEEDIARLMAENAALREAARWRKWPEEKPTERGWYLTAGTCGEMDVRGYHADIYAGKSWVAIEPAYWRPIDQPKEEPDYARCVPCVKEGSLKEGEDGPV